MKKLFILFITVTLAVMCGAVFASCKGKNNTDTSDTASSNDTTASSQPESSETTSAPNENEIVLEGYVVDDYNAPISGANVAAAGATAVSGENGSYSLTIPRGASFEITATKNGYFNGTSGSLTDAAPNADKLNIKLLKKHYVSGVVYNSAATRSGGRVAYAAGAIIKVTTDKSYTATADAQGKYSLEFAAAPFASNATVYYDFGGGGSVYQVVSAIGTVTEGATVRDVTLTPGTVISGKVTKGGLPVEGAVIKIQPKINDGSAATKTIETILITNEKGEHTSVGLYLFYAGEYNVIAEIKDGKSQTKNDKGEKIKIESVKLTVSGTRVLTANFTLPEDVYAPELHGIYNGNIYSPQKSFTASVSFEDGATPSAYAWYIKSGNGAYPSAPNGAAAAFVYTPENGKTSRIKLVVTVGGKNYTVESEEFTYNYVPLLLADSSQTDRFVFDNNGGIHVKNTTAESAASFFNDNNIKEMPELFMDIVFINSFRMEATFEFISGAKNGSREALAGLLATGRKGTAAGTGALTRGSREYPYGCVVYSSGGSLVSGWANDKKTAAYSGALPNKIRVVVDFIITRDLDTHTNGDTTNHQNIAYVITSFYTASGELIGTSAEKLANMNSIFDGGFMYPGLTFDNVECRVSDIVFTAKENETIRRDLMKSLLDTTGASSLGTAYDDALTLYNVTSGTVMNKVTPSAGGGDVRGNYRYREYYNDFKAKYDALKTALNG